MIRQALIQNARHGQTSTIFNLPVPVGGLNAQDALADMKPEYALILTNLFPGEGSVSARRGFQEHFTGLPDTIDTLIVWNGPSSLKMLAATGDSIFNVSNSGSVGSATTAMYTSLTSVRLQYTNLANTAGNFTVMVNGEDTPLKYDGSSVTTTTITGTGLTATDLIYVASHKKRLWFVEKQSTDAWYLATDAISGAAVKFPLGSSFREGGHLVAIGSFSADAGDGMDDFAAFISDRGEIAVYAGTDPASASTWSLVGVYKTGEIIGQRPLVRLGGDLFLLTHDGLVSMTDIIKLSRAEAQYASPGNKIMPLLNNAARNYDNNFGWEAVNYARGKWLLINIPVIEGQSQIQYVMNITTGAWCDFSGMNANCWAVYNDEIYFGGDTAVYKADSTQADNGNDINTEMSGAYSYLRNKKLKQFMMMRPVIGSDGVPSFQVGVNIDFEEIEPMGSVSANPQEAWMWDDAVTGIWGNMVWGGARSIIKAWTGISGIGIAVAPHFIANINGQSCELFSFDILYEQGGVY